VERSLKAGVLGLGIVGLLVVVAIAAHGGHPGLDGEIAERPVPNTVQDTFVNLLAIAYIIVVVASIIALFRMKQKWHDPKSRWLLNFAVLVLLMLAATSIGYYGLRHARHLGAPPGTQREREQQGPLKRPRAQPAPIPGRTAQFQWPLAAGIGGFILLGGVWLYIRRRRGSDGFANGDALDAALLETVEATVDDLRAERDPRRAVIAAYAQMERTFAEHGVRRRPAEAPLEYFARVLRARHVREGAVRTLTELFEYAKFSRHEIDDAMKERAIAALLAVRDDLLQREEVAA
jgi:Domain of unknown function (DUF4129)